VRDLLHEHVSAEKLNSPPDSEQHRRAMQSLRARWEDLVAREQEFRRDRRFASIAIN